MIPIQKMEFEHFVIPELNFAASNYIDLIDWQNLSITEPPVFSTLSRTDLWEIIASDCVPVFQFPKFPCHTQSVERSVKLVTEASAAVVGQTSRCQIGITRNNAPFQYQSRVWITVD